MRLAWLAVAAASALSAQVVATLKPISTVTSRAIVGEGRAIGVWTVTLCSRQQSERHVDRGEVFSQALQIRELPNDLAQDVAGRQADADSRSVLGSVGDQLVGLAGDGSLMAGIAADTPAALYAGAGLKVAQLILRLVKRQAPNPTPYFSRLLPDEVVLPAMRCSPAMYFFASRMPKAAPVQVTIP